MTMTGHSMRADWRAAWAGVRERLRRELGDAVFEAWIAPLTLEGFERDELSIGAAKPFVRNWVVDLSGGDNTAPPFTSKALSVGIGAGWEWRVSPRFGVQVYGSQHVAALGDLRANNLLVENVVGNFWSLGGAIVFR